MITTLSSNAAGEAKLAELLAACSRRGLAGVELVEGDAHGLVPAMESHCLDAVDTALETTRVQIVALRVAAASDPDLIAAYAALAARYGSALVVPGEGVDAEAANRLGAIARAAGARLLFSHDSDVSAAAALRECIEVADAAEHLGLAWEVRPADDDPEALPAVMAAAGAHLSYVRLHGGGPESVQQTGRGVGSLIARLTLARFAGPLVLTPSTTRYHYIWRAWLGAGKGWGCGSKKSDPSLVAL